MAPDIIDTQKLPTEILSEIFVHSLETNFETYISTLTHEPITSIACLNSTPLLLTRVCRRWRTIATESPSVWTSLLLPDLPKNSALHEPFFAQLKTWLARSRSLPCSLAAPFKWIPYGEPKKSAWMRYITIVFAESHRWKAVWFDFHLVRPSHHRSPVRNTLGELPSVKPPLLLQNFVCRAAQAPPSLAMTLNLPTAPLLREVTLRDTLVCYWDIPWSQITMLRLINASFDAPHGMMGQGRPRSFIEMLARCSRLEHLYLRNITLFRRMDGDCSIPSLLALDADWGTAPRTLFDSFHGSITAPCLRSLTVHVGNLLVRSDTKNSFIEFLEGCSHSLREFTLSASFIRIDDLESILSIVPDLSYLKLNYKIADTLALCALTYGPPGQEYSKQLCPHLVRFRIDEVPEAGSDDSFAVFFRHLVKMLESRRGPDGASATNGIEHSPLELFEMDWVATWSRLGRTELGKEMQARIQMLREGGLRCEL